ncbi:2-C-methyl-D-erythritol 4-phosphate cytidylyltransferase [Cupriavidus basilensis]
MPRSAASWLCPCLDTLKRADAGTRIGTTVPRDGLWQARTRRCSVSAYCARPCRTRWPPARVVTDEASAIERLGLHPRLVNGSLRNFKVTYPEDFALAEVLLGTAAARSADSGDLIDDAF